MEGLQKVLQSQQEQREQTDLKLTQINQSESMTQRTIQENKKLKAQLALFREKEAKQDEANQTLAQKYNSVCTDYQKLKAKICQMELNEK